MNSRPKRAPIWFLIVFTALPLIGMGAGFTYGYWHFGGVWSGILITPMGFVTGSFLARGFGYIVDPLHERRLRH